MFHARLLHIPRRVHLRGTGGLPISCALHSLLTQRLRPTKKIGTFPYAELF